MQIMSYPSFVLQAAKLSWLTATEGSFGSASWIKAETFVSASTTLVRFQARWTAQLERRDVYQDYQNNWSGKRNWRKPTHKGATTPSTLHSQETAKSKTLARLSLWITIFTWNAMIWKLSIAAWHPAVQKIMCVHPRIVGPNQAPKPNICFGLLG